MCVGVCVVRGAGGEMQYSAEMLIIYLFKSRTTVDKTKGVNLSVSHDSIRSLGVKTRLKNRYSIQYYSLRKAVWQMNA